MKKIKSFTTLIIAIILSTNLFAGKVSKKDAERAARNFYYESINRQKDVGYEKILTSSVTSYKMKSQEMYYVVNLIDKGFVLVAADDAAYPILGYSYEGSFNPDQMNNSVKEWMGIYCKQIEFVRKSKLGASPETTTLWNHLLTSSPAQLTVNKGAKDVAPKLLSVWNQDPPYNDLCPQDAASSPGYGGRCPVGCTATSMAQILYYYRYPIQGTGSNTDFYTDYGNLYANFGATTYDYSQMLNNNTASNLALATLNLHCGIAVNMNYGPDGSAAGTDQACDALITNFKYSSLAHYYLKIGHQYSGTWADLLKGSLDQNKMIIYSGSSGVDGGHAWVCDGYEATDHFHFNWGWGGAYNGFYYIGGLNPGTSDFNDYNGAVVNIYPGSGYPYYCNSSTTLTSLSGSFEDGSGPLDYQNNSDCRWLIQPTDSVKKITLSFTAFTLTDTSDKVIVYNGNSITSPVLATITGSAIPNSVSSTGAKMLVRFLTNGSGVSAGWQATYTSTPYLYCSGLTTLTTPNGTISDGSGDKNYANSSLCRWWIKPNGARSITFTFNHLDTEPGLDTILFRDPVNATNLITVSGNTIPGPIFSPSGQLLMTFRSNNSNAYAGWDGTYSAEVGINENEFMDNLMIYPNPASALLNLSFDLSNTQNMNISLTDLTGKEVFSEKVENLKGSFSRDIDVSLFNKGIYFLKLISSEGNITQKIVLQ